MNRVAWNKVIVREFKNTAYLTEIEEVLLDMRIKELPNSVIADELGVSMSTLHRMLRKLLKKYDEAQAVNPILPKARKSEKEKWMDTH